MASDDKVTTASPSSGSGTVTQVRVRIAQVVSLVCTLAAVFLAVGAVLIALKANINEGNAIVKAIIDVADAIDGPFSRDNGIFTFSGKNAATKEALVNWGLAAIVWLVVGRVLDRIIRP